MIIPIVKIAKIKRGQKTHKGNPKTIGLNRLKMVNIGHDTRTNKIATKTIVDRLGLYMLITSLSLKVYRYVNQNSLYYLSPPFLFDHLFENLNALLNLVFAYRQGWRPSKDIVVWSACGK